MVEAPRFDLQAHSEHSDGELSAAAVVHAASAAGVELLALTDHDSVDGVDGALTEAASLPIRVVPAVELTAVDGRHEDLHVLGYCIDHRSGLLLERLRSASEDREHRAISMVKRLRDLGFTLDDSDLRSRISTGQVIGRPHIAAAALANPANRPRLAANGLAGTMSEFISRYLTVGSAAYVPRKGPSVPEAIRWIHDAGGVAVWAHPFCDVANAEALAAMLDRFDGWGLDGVECFYPTHSAAETRLLADACVQRGLLRTGSSDFHGPNHAMFSQFRSFQLHGCQPLLGPLL